GCAIGSSSGCAAVGSEHAATRWTRRGFPYFLVDVTLGQVKVPGREIHIEAAFSVRTLTGFAQGGAPVYETRTEKRTLRVPEGDSAVVPILVASQRETDQFR